MSGPVFLVLRFLIAFALYAFLGWALWLLWRDLKARGEALASPKAPPITLIQQAQAGAQPARFTTEEVVIGRDPASDLMLQDGTISIRHALLSYHHNQWWVEDLKSKNGTFLNQEAVEEPLVVTSGDQLRCGGVVLKISFAEEEPVQFE